MRRRELMPLLGGALTAGRAVRAQQKAMPMIGFLNPTMPSAAAPNMGSLPQWASKTGYFEGQNMAIEYRWAEGRVDWPTRIGRHPHLVPGHKCDRRVEIVRRAGSRDPLPRPIDP
jgi:hypothetical protein